MFRHSEKSAKPGNETDGNKITIETSSAATDVCLRSEILSQVQFQTRKLTCFDACGTFSVIGE